jgi:flagellar basal body-associated protein FliL
MDEKIIRIKEKILISLIVVLIILVPFSLLFEEKSPSVKIDNFEIININDSSQKVIFSLGDYLEGDLYCKVRVLFYLNNEKVREEIKNVGLIHSGENMEVDFIFNLPDGDSKFRMKPECAPIYEFP